MNSPLLTDVIRIAKEAGEIIMKYYGREYITSTKSDNSPVTDADLAANEYICKELAKYQFPILSEESADDLRRLQQETIWIIDPLDGTKHFIQKEADFAVMIGLAKQGRPILGVVYQPVTKICFYAESGKGAYLQKEEDAPQKMLVSDMIEDLRLVLSANSQVLQRDPRLTKLLHVKEVVRMGSVGLKMGFVAQGGCDINFNTSKSSTAWDTCAPEIILLEAGGMVTDLLGNPLRYNEQQVKHRWGFLATNSECHQQALSVLTPIIRKWRKS